MEVIETIAISQNISDMKEKGNNFKTV